MKTEKKFIKDKETLKMIPIRKFHPNEVINCQSQEDFNSIIKLVGGSLPPHYWETNGRYTCYRPFFGTYMSITNAKNEGFIIIPASEFLCIPQTPPDPIQSKQGPKPIDNVTVDRLNNVLKLSGIHLNKEVIDKIIHCVELIEDKGGEVTLNDIQHLEDEWDKANLELRNK